MQPFELLSAVVESSKRKSGENAALTSVQM